MDENGNVERMERAAREDYPEAAGPTLAAYIRQHAAMCNEIDRLRAEVGFLRNRVPCEL